MSAGCERRDWWRRREETPPTLLKVQHAQQSPTHLAASNSIQRGRKKPRGWVNGYKRAKAKATDPSVGPKLPSHSEI